MVTMIMEETEMNTYYIHTWLFVDVSLIQWPPVTWILSSRSFFSLIAFIWNGNSRSHQGTKTLSIIIISEFYIMIVTLYHLNALPLRLHNVQLIVKMDSLSGKSYSLPLSQVYGRSPTVSSKVKR